MTDDVELLTLPEEEWNVRYGYTADTMQAYARANIEIVSYERDVARECVKDMAAEIESLRAKWIRAEDRLAACDSDLLTMQLRAERLAEALRDAKGYINSFNYPGVISGIEALLRDQEEGK